MAQRTGAERFIAPFAKAASARTFLALAAAGAVLAGCGGGSPSPSSFSGESDTTESTHAVASRRGRTTASTAERPAIGNRDKNEGSGSNSTKGSDSGPDAGPNAAGGKRGAHIVPPKGPVEQAPSPEQVTNATIASMSLQSPAVVASSGSPGRLASTYTCDGHDQWPTLHWGGVPAGTTELILYLMNVQPVNEDLFVDWAVAGLKPSSDEIKAGEMPKGAIVGTNSFGRTGYSICPSGAGEIYMFALYALPRSLSPTRGFDARNLRQEILDVSGNVGLLPAVYERG